jgi:putative ATP-grasp target RiPP
MVARNVAKVQCAAIRQVQSTYGGKTQIKRRPLIARDFSTLELRDPTYHYDPNLQLSVDQHGHPIVETADVSTHTITKRDGDPPESPDVISAVATHTITRQQGDPPESPDVWDIPGPQAEPGDITSDDLSTGVVTF